MPTYTITIPDKLKASSLVMAKDEYNNNLANGPRARRTPNIPLDQLPGFLNDEEEYLQIIVERHIQQLVAKFGLDDSLIATKQAELDTLKANLAAAKAGVAVVSSV